MSFTSPHNVLEDFESATSRIGRGQNAAKGLVRVAVAPSFARLHMVTKLAAFFDRYPEIAIEFGACDNLSTLIEQGFDLLIHSGDLPDSGLVARRFAQTLTILVATPQFVTRHGLPQSIEELRGLPAIPRVENGSVQPWEFGVAEQIQRFTPSGVFRTGELEQLRMGVLEHLGVAQAASLAIRGRTARKHGPPAVDCTRGRCQSWRVRPARPSRALDPCASSDGALGRDLCAVHTVQPTPGAGS